MKFKVGDIVRCIKIGPTHKSWADITIGKIYIVYGKNGHESITSDNGNCFYINACLHRDFKLVKKRGKFHK